MSTTQSITDTLYNQVLDIIKTKKVEVNDAFTLVAYGAKLIEKTKGMDLDEKKVILLKVFEKIAKGNDGQFGTVDDVIPEHIWKQVETLLNSNMLHSLISLVFNLITKKLPELTHKTTTCLSSLCKK